MAEFLRGLALGGTKTIADGDEFCAFKHVKAEG
jgi:hypothetical protein